MKTFTYTIKDELGIHARPAGLMVKEAKRYACEITLECKGKSADLKKLFAIMGMGVKQGDEVTINVEGADETEAATALQEFIGANF